MQYRLIKAANFIATFCSIKGTLSGWRKIYEKRSVLLRIIWFFEWWLHVISYHPVKFVVHRPFKIRNIMFFICHETTYNQRIMWLCALRPNIISYDLAEFGSHKPFGNSNATLFILQVALVLSDNCGWWRLVLSHQPVTISDHSLLGLAVVEI